MNKQELINSVSERSGESKATVGRIIDSLTGVITDTLTAGEEVSLPDIGKLVVTSRAARTVNSPFAGGTREVPASNSVKLRVAKRLKDAVN